MKAMFLTFSLCLFSLFHLSGADIADEDPFIDLHAHIAAFPFEAYVLCEVPGLGSFYVDPIDDIIKNQLRKGRVWEPRIVEIVKKYVKSGSEVLDIGAHIGTISLVMSAMAGEEGRVHSFEPKLKLFREIGRASCRERV